MGFDLLRRHASWIGLELKKLKTQSGKHFSFYLSISCFLSILFSLLYISFLAADETKWSSVTEVSNRHSHRHNITLPTAYHTSKKQTYAL